MQTSEGDFNKFIVSPKKGARTDTADQQGRTPMLLAAYNGYEEGAKVLMAHGAAPDAVDKVTPISSRVHFSI